MKLNRRHLLASIPALLAAAPVRALTLNEASAPLQELLNDRCGITEEHARYLAEADRILKDAGYGETERKAALAELSCPVCGCAIKI
ncbi:MAG: hypothetical protein EPN26_13690 [Rhodospirillales bacterium]|nr:MAG: hypothetical protein EPN26_13690 [Rhodospirillales bacterium]